MNHSCSVCNLPLIKQYLKNNDVLTYDELQEYNLYEELRNITHECKKCGNKCYSNHKNHNGYGLCKNCGGNFKANIPVKYKNVKIIQYSKFWSCPIHGFK